MCFIITTHIYRFYMVFPCHPLFIWLNYNTLLTCDHGVRSANKIIKFHTDIPFISLSHPINILLISHYIPIRFIIEIPFIDAFPNV